jgi:hypothetical protein
VKSFATALAFVSICALARAQTPARTLQLEFTATAESFNSATEEYRTIWAKEGSRIVAVMERVSGLGFEPGPIPVRVYEGVSYSGRPGGPPMVLRASYPEPTKRGTLVHELGHRLAADVPFKGEHHELIFLFVYDAWVDLWGQPFADDQVAIESKRTGIVDYAGIWKKTLVIPRAERSRRLQGIVRGTPRE